MDTPSAKPSALPVRCKVCGYITGSDKIKDLCPCCGVKASMFEPLTEKFSDARRKFLDLHIHPVLVHFPQAFSILMLILAVGAIAVSGTVKQMLSDTFIVLSFALPFTVIGSFFSGIKDGNVRYKKLTAPFLKRKITVGIAYIILSSINLAVILISSASSLTAGIAAVALSLGLVVCTAILGKLGAELANGRMPG